MALAPVQRSSAAINKITTQVQERIAGDESLRASRSSNPRDALHHSGEDVTGGSGWGARRLFAVNSWLLTRKTTKQTARVRLITDRHELCRGSLGVTKRPQLPAIALVHEACKTELSDVGLPASGTNHLMRILALRFP